MVRANSHNDLEALSSSIAQRSVSTGQDLTSVRRSNESNGFKQTISDAAISEGGRAKERGHRREVAEIAIDEVKERSNGGLVRGDQIEIAHPPNFSNPWAIASN
jgi:hypothetical protein